MIFRMMRAWVGVMLLGCFGAWGQGVGNNGTGGGQNKPTVVAETEPKLNRPSDYKVGLLAGPVGLGDFSEMAPRAGLREQMTEIEGFVQSNPTNGKPESERTEVWVGHTRSVLYAVFVCHDRHPERIRSHLARRENILTDDRVGLLLDTFADRRRGVLFEVNPAGVQADAAYTEGNGTDYSYDQVWDSDARVTKDGWLALIAIPFTSLRFKPGAGGWGVVLRRSLPRNSETDEWPAISAEIAGKLSQEGTLRGIEGVSGSHNLQVNPYGLAQNEHGVNSVNPAEPYFSSRRLEGTFGGDLKAIVKDSIVLDATVNPDFSQVESEQPQFTVNQRYPV